MGAMLEDDKEEDGGLDPAFGPSSAAGATSQASAAAVRAAAGADQGRRGGGALPGMEARMEEGWTTMRLAERKLLNPPRTLLLPLRALPRPVVLLWQRVGLQQREREPGTWNGRSSQRATEEAKKMGRSGPDAAVRPPIRPPVALLPLPCASLPPSS